MSLSNAPRNKAKEPESKTACKGCIASEYRYWTMTAIGNSSLSCSRCAGARAQKQAACQEGVESGREKQPADVCSGPLRYLVRAIRDNALLPGEARGDAIHAFSQDNGVERDSHELCAQFQAFAGTLFLYHEYPRRFACTTNAPNGIIDDAGHFGVERLTRVAQARGKIGWPYENSINAIHGRDGLQVGQRFGGLDLNQQAELFLGPLNIILCPAEIGCAYGTAHSTHTLRGITHGIHGSCCLFGVLDKGQKKSLSTQIEIAFYQHHVVPSRTYHRLRSRPARSRLRGGQCLYLRQHERHVIGGMLGIQQRPVVTGSAKELGNIRGRNGGPNANLGLPCFQGFLEGIGGQHASASLRGRTKTRF